jgi:hypothetical protein
MQASASHCFALKIPEKTPQMGIAFDCFGKLADNHRSKHRAKPRRGLTLGSHLRRSLDEPGVSSTIDTSAVDQNARRTDWGDVT